MACIAALSQTLAADLALPFHDSFDTPALDPAWEVDVSGDNALRAGGGRLEIVAREHTYAHVQRRLGVDHVRAACMLTPRGGISWVSSLFLYWDERNWCQISVLDPEANYYAVQLIDGRLHEHRRAVGPKSEWYRLGLVLGPECVRWQAGDDRGAWITWLVLPRPEPWRGRPPTLLILGKGFSRDEGEQHFNAPDLDNDFPDPGQPTTSRIYEVSVERLPAAELRLSERERRELAEPGRDWPGEEELAARADPSFASVSRHFPPMKFPRESLGVKDGLDEIVVLPQGGLGLAKGTTEFIVGTNYSARGGVGKLSRRLHEGGLPIVIARDQIDGLQVEQTAFAWSPNFDPDAPLSAWVRLELRNPGSIARKAPLHYSASGPGGSFDLFEGTLPAGGTRCWHFAIPYHQPADAREIPASEFEAKLLETAAWWRRLLSSGIQISVPEERVNHAWRAWLAYNFINVDKRGAVYEPHDGGGGFYELVYGYSASRYCHALDLMGFHADAERYLESILTFVSPEGLLMVNYGLPDTGAQLWAMGQHFQIARDAAWLRRVAPTMIKMCDWIINTRQANLARQPKDAPWYGLLKYRPYCDEPDPAYSYHSDTYLALGLEETARALAAVGLDEPARRLGAEAEAYRRDILASMDRSVFERNGVRMLPVFPETRALLERVGYTGADYYSLVSSMVLETELLPPNDPRARLITDLLERSHGLCLGTSQFRQGIDHAYTYGYWMNCLRRDEVRRVILGFYTSLAYGMTHDTYSGVEVTFLRAGQNEATLPHLYSGTQQLLLLRNMLLLEEGDDLWIARAVPRPWLEDGKEIRVERAPTRFGKTGFTIRSTQGARRMLVELHPPAHRPPARIHVRLRHPDHRPIRSATLNGRPFTDFAGDTLTLRGAQERVDLEVRF